MRRWLEILVGILIVIPITKLVTDDLIAPTGMVYNATATSVGTDGDFVMLLFQWWWIGWGMLLIIMSVYLIRKKLAGGIDIFGGNNEGQGGL